MGCCPLARCGCGGAAGTPCNCAVIAGPGIAVTGDGQGGSPYRISAAPGAEPTVAVADTPTIDMSLAVAGKQYTVSGAAKVSADSGNALSQRASGLYVAQGSGGPAVPYPMSVCKQTALQSIPNSTLTRLRIDEVTNTSTPGVSLVDPQTLRFDIGHWIVTAFVRYSGTFVANSMFIFWGVPGESNTRLSGHDPRSFDPGVANPGNHLTALLAPGVGLTDFSLWVWQNSGAARDTQAVSNSTHIIAKKLPT